MATSIHNNLKERCMVPLTTTTTTRRNRLLRFPETLRAKVPGGTVARIAAIAARDGSKSSDVIRRALLRALDEGEPTARVTRFVRLKPTVGDGLNTTSYVNLHYFAVPTSDIAAFGPELTEPSNLDGIARINVQNRLANAGLVFTFYDPNGVGVEILNLTIESIYRLIKVPLV